ncbi:N-acetyl-gamma-glutamyl-phosphate reductase [Salimicrobium halophilum]|uniref:N-acetyl-gamma-glutamyl-phosphate reductase n=1 Tax=Salimicrobium halophilum TaxID=86666 RepID=A0A1G8TMG5_9BACI|nr:N-acetyl-gamma-glutamyl-phosphate reductase [Salimicrobium halophilum]SDJ42594.1 N-acetyl-gamma-glutamyl-phosphate reductase [Salimicrobium halophilum]
MVHVGIVGATGYGGSELFRLLHNHPHVGDVSLYSSSQAGEPYSSFMPQVSGWFQEELRPIEEAQMKKDLDVLFLATPAGVSKDLTPSFLNSGVKVIDLSGDLRLKKTEDYEKWYKKESASEELLTEAVYGLVETNRKNIEASEIVANPGCYPTAVLLGTAPLAHREGWNGDSLIIDAKSGISGAGKTPSDKTIYANTEENFRIYKVNEHQHIPEIEQQLEWWGGETSPITFSPHLVPMTRGIMATMYVQGDENVSAQEWLKIYRDFYENSPFVRIREEFPSTKDVYASNFCDIHLTVDERTGRLTIVSVIDNLLKGASGQAVQNMNLMLGFEETEGLKLLPLYP